MLEDQSSIVGPDVVTITLLALPHTHDTPIYVTVVLYQVICDTWDH
jgi:hypothetical protein